MRRHPCSGWSVPYRMICSAGGSAAFYPACTPAGPLMFFFFQAEDGIRDLTVTGVQTCALPISGGHPDVTSINRNLARAAERYGLALGVGSKRAAIVNPDVASSYAVTRQHAPHALDRKSVV